MNDKLDTLKSTNLMVPYMTKQRFSEATGLPEGVIQGQMNRGQLPTEKIGKRRLINVAKMISECVDKD